ncbi:MAG: hypothetical protein Q9200_000490 [Gallowayella weberi]
MPKHSSRVSTHGFIHTLPQASKHRDTISSHQKPVPPEDVLFRRRHAPERYEEDDFYFANEDLTEGKDLPDSDMLKALHTYSSDFYGNTLAKKAVVDFRSMDETALMCMGLLLEEYVQSILGETGDLVFVETGEEKEGGAAIRGAGSERKKGFKEKEKGSIERERAVERGIEHEEASSDTSETEDEDESSSSGTQESERRGKLSANRKDRGSQETEETTESDSRDEESSENIEDEDQNSSSDESLSPDLVRARKRKRVEKTEDESSE